MRLIDADALTMVTEWDDEYQFWHKYYPKFEIDDARIVEAIPVSWIEETIELARKTGADKYAEHLEILLKDWREE